MPEPVAAEHADPSRLGDLWEMSRRPSDPANPGGVYEVIRTGEARLFPTLPPFNQLADPAQVRLLEKVGYTSMMLVPLRARNNTFGCLSLGAVGRRFTDADLALARSLAERGALAADNARLYREAQEANRMKDEFLATLSHELRTPLNAIVGWTKLLQDGQLDAATQARAIATIDRNARAQTQLIEDILDVSRIVAGKLNLDVRAVDLGAVIEGALDSVRHAAEAKGVRLVTEIARTVGPFEGDADRLQQVAWNLVSNAIKFTHARRHGARAPAPGGRPGGHQRRRTTGSASRRSSCPTSSSASARRTRRARARMAVSGSASPSCATSSSCTADRSKWRAPAKARARPSPCGCPFTAGTARPKCRAVPRPPRRLRSSPVSTCSWSRTRPTRAS